MIDWYLSYRKNPKARSAMASVAFALAISPLALLQACTDDGPDASDCRSDPAFVGDYNNGKAAAQTQMSQDYERGRSAT